MIARAQGSRRTRSRGGALVCSALVCSALACGDELEPTLDAPEPRPRLYMSVSSTGNEYVTPTRLAMVDLSNPEFPRVETILEGFTTGWVGIARGTGSPSGRYIFAKRIRNLDQPEPWARELFLIDFDGAPLGPPTRLSLQLANVSTVWSADETMVAFTGNDTGQSLWTMSILDGDPGPATRIPIELPAYDTYLSERRWDPGAERLYFLVRQSGEPWRLFVAHHEDREPVAVEELSAPNESGPTDLLWVGTDGRVLTRNQGECRIGSFDVEHGVARTLELPHQQGSCDIWFIAEDDGDPAWLAYVNFHEQPYRLRWVELDWVAHWIELGAITEVDEGLAGNPVFAGDRAYYLTEDLRLMHARAGASEAEAFGRVPSGVAVSGMKLNRDQTRLVVYGDLGVLSFELHADGPGPALLASPLGFGSWTLHHDRFVQTLLTSPETGHVRVVDLGARPPSAVDLPAVLPVDAIPSPIDSRVIVRDQTALFIRDTATPAAEAEALGEPIGSFVHEYMLHAPGLGTY